MDKESRSELCDRLFGLAMAELEIAILGTALTGSVTIQCQDGLVRTIRMGGDDGVIIWKDGTQVMSVLPSIGR